MNKRGMVDTQFHWLFVLLAGGFILFLFAIFIGQGIAANQEKQTALTLRYFDGVFASSQNLQNLDESVDSIKSLVLEQQCEPGAESRIQFVGQSLDKKITYLPLFSSKRVSGDKFIIKTLSYEAPFRADNPVYLTDSQTLFIVFSQDENIQQRLRLLLPKQASVVVTSDFATVTEEGYRDVVIITQDNGQLVSGTGGPDDLQRLSPKLLATNLRHVDVQTATSTVDFYSKGDASGAIFLEQKFDEVGNALNARYVDDATLLGAIMSDDPTIYRCELDKLVARTRAVALQISLRAQELSADPQTRAQCRQDGYEPAHDLILGVLGDSDPDATLDPDWQSQLSTYNDRLIRWTCPALY